MVLVGHSMGGMTIMRLAQTQPELFGTRIVGVALFATAAGEMADHSPIRGLPGRAFSRVAEPPMADAEPDPRSRRTQPDQAGCDLSFVVTKRMAFASDVPASYVEFMSEMLAKTPLEVVADFYPAFARAGRVRRPGDDRIATGPVIGGEDDRSPRSSTPTGSSSCCRTPTSRCAWPSCGHLGIIEHHEVFNERLDDLLDRVRARRR